MHTATFTAPVTATPGQPLRLRIAADYFNSPVPTACSTPQYSQTEDYQMCLAAGIAASVARFAAADTATCSGAVAFQDASLNTPTAWRWSKQGSSLADIVRLGAPQLRRVRRLHLYLEGGGGVGYLEQLAVGHDGYLAVFLQQHFVGVGHGAGLAVEVVEAAGVYGACLAL